MLKGIAQRQRQTKKGMTICCAMIFTFNDIPLAQFAVT